MSRGMTPTTTGLPHFPLQSLFLLIWKWKKGSHNRTKLSSCGLAKFRVFHSRIDWHGKIWHDFVALGLCLLEQLKTWTLQRKRYCDIINYYTGLDYLHLGGKIHCDVKPVGGNRSSVSCWQSQVMSRFWLRWLGMTSRQISEFVGLQQWN